MKIQGILLVRGMNVSSYKLAFYQRVYIER